MPSRVIDDLDARLLALLARDPQIGVLGAARELRVARGTVQARLDRMRASGVISSQAPQVSPAALGYGVTAFCTLQIRQGGAADAVAHLERIPQVMEVHTITGDGDLWVRLVARDNADLQRLIDEVVADPTVLRTSTVIALTERVAWRTGPLVEAAAGD